MKLYISFIVAFDFVILAGASNFKMTLISSVVSSMSDRDMEECSFSFIQVQI